MLSRPEAVSKIIAFIPVFLRPQGVKHGAIFAVQVQPDLREGGVAVYTFGRPVTGHGAGMCSKAPVQRRGTSPDQAEIESRCRNLLVSTGA